MAFTAGETAKFRRKSSRISWRASSFEEFIRQYPFDIISIHDDLHFIIDDPIMECNCGDFSLRWDAAGNTILERGGTRGETVRCDIQTLTAMFYGYKRPTYLKRVERLQANDTAVRILEDIIPSSSRISRIISKE